MRFFVYIFVLLLCSGSTIAATAKPPPLAIKAPSQKTFQATSSAGALVNYKVQLKNKTKATRLKCTPASGSVFPIGRTKVRCAAKQKPKKTSKTFKVVKRKAFYIMVVGTQAPTLKLPEAISVVTDSTEGRRVAYNVSATDNRGKKIDVICSPLSGSFFNVGTTNVECGAVNSQGKSTNGSFAINVFSQSGSENLTTTQPTDTTDPTPIAPEPTATPTQEPEITPEPESTPEPETTPEPTLEPEPEPEPEVIPTITITWASPTTRKDGTSLSVSEIGGYDIFIVADSTGNDETISINDPSVNEYVFQPSAADTYYISISTYDSQGVSSDLSNTVSVIIP